MKNQIVELYAKLFTSLENPQLEENHYVGWIRLDDERLESLRTLNDKGLVNAAFLFKKLDDEVSGPMALERITAKHFSDEYLFKIELVAQCTKRDTPIFPNWDALLKYDDYIKKPLDTVFFTEEGVLYTSDIGNLKFDNYHKVHKLYELIARLVDNTEGNGETIYYQRPLSFKYSLNSEDLECSIDIEALNSLLDKDSHIEAINHLICAQIVSRLKDIEIDRRFGVLVRQSNQFVADVLLDYKSYVENYSFDKVRKEYLERRTEYISGVHNVFDGIALKLLSLPAGLWFATSQINSDLSSPIGHAKNIVILITVILLSILLILNLLGQFATINAIQFENEEIFKGLAKQFEEEISSINDAKKTVDKAAFRVKFKLYVSIFVAITLVVLTSWLYIEAKKTSAFPLLILTSQN